MGNIRALAVYIRLCFIFPSMSVSNILVNPSDTLKNPVNSAVANPNICGTVTWGERRCSRFSVSLGLGSSNSISVDVVGTSKQFVGGMFKGEDTS